MKRCADSLACYRRSSGLTLSVLARQRAMQEAFELKKELSLMRAEIKELWVHVTLLAPRTLLS